jgi:hypothetical protein
MTLTRDTMIPELLQAAPQVRPVLDQYGLRGCGGTDGPVESLGFFARAHSVPIEQLLGELEDAVEHAPPPAPPAPDPAEAIYRPFFKAGIAIVLSLGAVWGAYLLLRIALAGSFVAAGLHEVNAHGHAQIFGWVGLFVMGFAYQAFPRFKHATLAWPRVARATLGFMLVGIVARSLAEPVAAGVPGLQMVAVGASLVEVVAILLFAAVIAMTWRRAGSGLEVHDYYIVCALGWFVIQAVYETAYLAATFGAATREDLLRLVATWQPALRDLQVHGFALLMILGVSQRIFHHFYGLRLPNARLARWALVGLNLAVIGEVAGLLLMRVAGHAWAGLWYAAVLLLAGCCVLLVCDWRPFRRSAEADRNLKFLRAAYIWLLISLAMLVVLPGYQYAMARLAPDSDAAGLGFSHAYYGAIRHAMTVGFVSMMIVGVAAKVVPTLNGLDVRGLSGLWLPFVLLNTGCGLRVVGQILTDFTPAAFPFAGVSGMLEVSALALWGWHLWSIMAGRVVARPPEQALLPVLADQPFVGGQRVGDVLDRYPNLLATFIEHGFTLLANPIARKLLAHQVTIGQACRRLNVPLAPLLEDLNRQRASNAVTNPHTGERICHCHCCP